jgi:preprotein translocase subunit YajC
MGILILLLFFAAAWLLLIVPRQRELKRHQALMAQLEPDDEVVLSSGVYGTIRSIEGEFVQLEVAPGLELKVAKRAVAALAVEPEPEASGDGDSDVDLTDEDEVEDEDVAADRDRPDLAGS